MRRRGERHRVLRAAILATPLCLAWLLACTADVRLGDLAQPEGTGDGSLEGAGGNDGALVGDSSASIDAPANDGSLDGALANDASDANGDGAACAIDCHGNPCIANVCQALLLAKGLKSPLYLAVDATDVFFTEMGHAGTAVDPNPVSRIGKAGGAKVTLAMDDGLPRGIAVDATNVYWNDAAEDGAENVWRASKADGSGAAIAGRMPTPVDIQGIALSQDAIFAASGTQIRYFGKTASMSFGGEATTVLVHVIGVAVTSDNSFGYGADLGSGALGVLDQKGGTTTPVPLGNQPVDVAIDADYAFVATGAQIVRVSRVDQTTLVLATGLTGAVGVAVDPTTLYFTTQTEVRKVPKGGGASTVIVTGLSSGGRIVADNTYVFYSDPVLGIIGRAPK